MRSVYFDTETSTIVTVGSPWSWHDHMNFISAADSGTMGEISVFADSLLGFDASFHRYSPTLAFRQLPIDPNAGAGPSKIGNIIMHRYVWAKRSDANHGTPADPEMPVNVLLNVRRKRSCQGVNMTISRKVHPRRACGISRAENRYLHSHVGTVATVFHQYKIVKQNDINHSPRSRIRA